MEKIAHRVASLTVSDNGGIASDYSKEIMKEAEKRMAGKFLITKEGEFSLITPSGTQFDFSNEEVAERVVVTSPTCFLPANDFYDFAEVFFHGIDNADAKLKKYCWPGYNEHYVNMQATLLNDDPLVEQAKRLGNNNGYFSVTKEREPKYVYENMYMLHLTALKNGASPLLYSDFLKHMSDLDLNYSYPKRAHAMSEEFNQELLQIGKSAERTSKLIEKTILSNLQKEEEEREL